MHNDTRSYLERVFCGMGRSGCFSQNCFSLAHIPFFVVVLYVDAHYPEHFGTFL